MDVDAYVTAHRAEWDRLDVLVGRRNLTGSEADELIDLYQRAATHLSVVQSQAPDPALVARLSSLVARARARVTGVSTSGWGAAARFLRVDFPVAVWRVRWWVLGAGLGFCLVALAIGWWVAATPEVQASIATPEQVRQLVGQSFEDYYSSNPAGSFAFRVWTNNAWVAALCIALGGFYGIPVLYLLWTNAFNLGIVGGLMAANGRLDLFFGLILPHGMLELTCVFVAAGVGLRLGWSLIDPGPLTRGEAFSHEARAAVGVALGLGLVLLVSGLVEAFVTPSGLPTWTRISIGFLVWSVFVGWVVVLGRPAAGRGETGDLAADLRGDVLPTAG
ncbi:MAG TPA: stage II sporulation protein M [Candidatus Limnocylindria bacterium]|nr:stage II sporulation protein M [Candidatus Limnocylindria bacterium]